MAKKRWFTPVMVGALLTASGSGLGGLAIAYGNHIEAVMLLDIEKVRLNAELDWKELDRLEERRAASCSAAITWLGDETPNPALSEVQIAELVLEMKKLALSCSEDHTENIALSLPDYSQREDAQ